MELNDDGIEHQATADKGLKMKIKRKQPGGGGSRAPTRTVVNDETNKLAKNSLSCVETMTDGGDSRPGEEDAGSAGSDGGPSQRSQKRKRNSKTGKSREVDAATDKPSSENENRARGRDLCQYSRNKDPLGCALERSSNRKRPISSTQDLGNDGNKDQADYMEDKEHVNKIGNKSVEYGCPAAAAASASASEKSDFPCIPEVVPASEREKQASTHSSDPYEFILRLEDLQQIPAKKFKSEKVCNSS